MDNTNRLPKSWIPTTVGNLYNVVSGGTPSTKVENYWGGNIPWITSANIHGLKDIRPERTVTKSGIINSATNLVPKGSIIVVTRVSLGKVALADEDICFSQDSQALLPTHSIIPEYSLYYLSWAAREFQSKSRGTTISGITKKQLLNLYFPLPPLPEQKRIVAKIEELFTQLDAGVAELHKAKAQLKRYRQAVLKAAVEGELTREWREAHQDELEPASELLERILVERKAKWEEEELAKMRSKGKEPKDDKWKQKYKDPEALDTNGLSRLPDGWEYVTLSMITSLIADVDHRMPKGNDTGIPYISTRDFFGENDINFQDAKKISEEDYSRLCRKIKPEFGDILISRYGTVGIVRIVNTTDRFQASYSIAIIKMLFPEELKHYFAISLKSAPLQSQIRRDIRATAQPDLGLSHIREFILPFPPLNEQKKIGERVERRISIANEIEQQLEQGLKRAERLRKSILMQAFEGKLMPQDPNDEPATGLIERIKAKKKKTAVQLTLMGDQS